MFLVAYVLSQFFRSFLAVIAPELGADLALSPADLGFVSGCWFGAFALAQFPVGWALDRIGPRRTMSWLMLAAAAGSMLLAVAGSRIEAAIAMALIGVGCAPIYMGALYVFARTLPAERFALSASWLLGLGTAGNLLAATPLAVVAERLSWRAAFFAIALLTLVVTGLVACIVRDPPRATGAAAGQSAFAEIAQVLSVRALWPLLPLVLVSYAVVAGERGLWMGPYMSEVHGLGPVARGNAALIMAAAMSAGAILYGPLDAWLGTRKWVVAVGSAITAAAFAALSATPAGESLRATVLLALIGAIGSTYGVLMAHGRQFIPEHLVGRGLTTINFVFIGGISVLQWMSGRFVDAAKAGGANPPDVFASLHLGFAVALAMATLIYLASRDRVEA